MEARSIVEQPHGRWGGIRWLGLGAALAAAFVIGWTPSVASGAINVESDAGVPLAKFKSVECKVKKAAGPGKTFTARTKKFGDLSLIVYVYSFNGFHSYDIEYGTEGPVTFYFGGPGAFFSNIFDPSPGPPGPDLTQGGSVDFLKKGRVFRIAFLIAYDSDQPTAWVRLLGTAPCK